MEINPLPSPTSSTSSNTNNNNNNNNGIFLNHHHHHHSLSSPPATAKSHSHQNPNPTTFVQADTTSFKQVVQMLTGSSKPVNPIPPIKTSPGKSKPSSKLYERRHSLKNNHHHLHISPSGFGSGFSPRNNHHQFYNPEILSPSLLDFPSLALSPVTPLIPDPFNRSPAPAVVDTAEEKAIAEKGFFLHPSPATTPRDSEPRLLPLFPETSPRVSGSNPAS